mgnify:FL=1
MPYTALFKDLNLLQGSKYIYKDQIICMMQLSWQNDVNNHYTGLNHHHFDIKIFKDDQIIINYHSIVIFELGLYLWYLAMFNKTMVTLDDNNSETTYSKDQCHNVTDVVN